jgi:hypothetical protein
MKSTSYYFYQCGNWLFLLRIFNAESMGYCGSVVFTRCRMSTLVSDTDTALVLFRPSALGASILKLMPLITFYFRSVFALPTPDQFLFHHESSPVQFW